MREILAEERRPGWQQE